MPEEAIDMPRAFRDPSSLWEPPVGSGQQATVLHFSALKSQHCYGISGGREMTRGSLVAAWNGLRAGRDVLDTEVDAKGAVEIGLCGAVQQDAVLHRDAASLHRTIDLSELEQEWILGRTAEHLRRWS